MFSKYSGAFLTWAARLTSPSLSQPIRISSLYPGERLLRNELRESLKEIERLSMGVPFDFNNLQQRWVWVLFARQFELARDFYRAYSSNAISGAQIILRSLLEASVDLFNLCADASYAENLEANDLKEWLKLMKEAGTNCNPYLSSLSEVEGLDEQGARWEQDLRRKTADGHGPLSAFARFDKAGMTDIYRSVYNSLCGYSHNSLRALMDRHIRVSDDKIEVFFSQHGPSRPAQWFLYLDLVIGLLGQGSSKALQLLGSHVSQARVLEEKIEKVRSDASRASMDERK